MSLTSDGFSVVVPLSEATLAEVVARIENALLAGIREERFAMTATLDDDPCLCRIIASKIRYALHGAIGADHAARKSIELRD
jgi:hypothetical protein